MGEKESAIIDAKESRMTESNNYASKELEQIIKPSVINEQKDHDENDSHMHIIDE